MNNIRFCFTNKADCINSIIYIMTRITRIYYLMSYYINDIWNAISYSNIV